MSKQTILSEYFDYLSVYGHMGAILSAWARHTFGSKSVDLVASQSEFASDRRKTIYTVKFDTENGEQRVDIEVKYTTSVISGERLTLGISTDTKNPLSGVVYYEDILGYSDGEFNDESVHICHPFVATLRREVIGQLEYFVGDGKTDSDEEEKSRFDDFDDDFDCSDDECEDEDEKSESESDRMFKRFQSALNGELGCGIGFGVCESIEEFEKVLSMLKDKFGSGCIGFGMGFGGNLGGFGRFGRKK